MSESAISKNKLLAILLTGQLLGQATATIANVAAPAIKDDLHADNAAIELMVGVYLIAFAVLLITGARLGNTYGYKKMFLGGVALFGFSSLICALAPDMTILILGRALQGVSAALMFPQTLTGIHLYFSGSGRLQAMGFYSMALASGAIIGQVLGGLLIAADVAQLGWRSVFLIYVPICTAIILLGKKLLPADQPQIGQRIDMAGVGTLSLGILLFILPLTIGREMGWPVWAVLSLLACIPVLWWFVRIQRQKEKRQTAPLIAVSVIFRPAILWALLSMLLATSVYYAFIFTFSFYYQSALSNTALLTAALLTPWAIGFAFSGQVLRRIPDRLDRSMPFVGYIAFAVTLLAIGFVSGDSFTAIILTAIIFVFSGIGQGVGFIALMRHLTNIVPRNYAADLSGVSTTAIEISGALGVAVFGGIYAFLVASPQFSSLHAAFMINCFTLAATGIAAALTAWLSLKARGK